MPVDKCNAAALQSTRKMPALRLKFYLGGQGAYARTVAGRGIVKNIIRERPRGPFPNNALESMTNDFALRDVCVLVTRPSEQGQALCAQIEAAGGCAIHIPVIEIVAPKNIAALRDVTERLPEFELAIFVSTNAASWCVRWLRDLGADWPTSVGVGAVGKATAKELLRLGIHVNLIPNGRYDSEGLLTLAALQQVANKRIIIFRGEGGREHLASELKQRGASVEYAEVYARRRPQASLNQLLPAAKRAKVNCIVVTSNEGLQNLYDMAGESLRNWLVAMPLVVLSQRAVTLAKQLGFKREPVVAPQASDQAIVETIEKWPRQQ